MSQRSAGTTAGLLTGGAITLVVVLAAGAAAGAATLMAGLGAGPAPSAAAARAIPPAYLALYQQAATTCPGLSWTLLAAIGTVESDNGQSTLPGLTLGVNRAGIASGPMQFVPPGGADRPARMTRSTPSTRPPAVTLSTAPRPAPPLVDHRVLVTVGGERCLLPARSGSVPRAGWACWS